MAPRDDEPQPVVINLTPVEMTVTTGNSDQEDDNG